MQAGSESESGFMQVLLVVAACSALPLLLTRRGQVRSGQVYYSAEVQDHESHKAAYATSEHRLLKSSYVR